MQITLGGPCTKNGREYTNENDVCTEMKETRPRDRHRLKWGDNVEEDITEIGVIDLREKHFI